MLLWTDSQFGGAEIIRTRQRILDWGNWRFRSADPEEIPSLGKRDGHLRSGFTADLPVAAATEKVRQAEQAAELVPSPVPVEPNMATRIQPSRSSHAI